MYMAYIWFYNSFKLYTFCKLKFYLKLPATKQCFCKIKDMMSALYKNILNCQKIIMNILTTVK